MKKFFMIFMMSLLIFSCNKSEKNKVETPETKPVQENIFKNIDVDKLATRLEEITLNNGIKIDDFKDLDSEGKAFYYSTLNGSESEILTINYESLTPTAIVGKVENVDEEKMEIIKKISFTIIKASDTNITDADAEKIYEELLQKLEGTVSVSLTYSNNLTYGVEITGDEMSFSVK